ncbi:uncharacterized protein LOC124441068 [Xenia sp. Carnegie-2017]|uniref:uncharacterized protein LOC124441068 n=1 Tax=Xenia sp. Carnegie-2017 TaxID=2897299 RepID=UPI001F047F85|nr:uncharacterized protein LOC124441068 [Xenia sp. Carnegie-2017]
MPSFNDLTNSELSTLLKKNGVDNENFKSDSLPVTPIQCPNALNANTSTLKDSSRNYKIPNRYSYAVKAGLKTEYLHPNLINELIRDVCTSVLRFTNHPSKTERVKIALMIVESYPFLKDPLLDANSKPWVNNI